MNKSILASILISIAVSSNAYCDPVSGIISGHGASVSGVINNTLNGSISGSSQSGSEFMNNFNSSITNSPTNASFSSTGYGHNISGMTINANGIPQTFSTSNHTNTTTFKLPTGMKTNGEVLSGANGSATYSLSDKMTVKLNINSFNGKGAESFTNIGKATLPGTSNTGSNSTNISNNSLSSIPYNNGSGYANLTGSSVLGSVSGKNGTFYILGNGQNLQGNDSTSHYFTQFGDDQSTIYK